MSKKASDFDATYLPLFIGVDRSLSMEEDAGGKTRMDRLNELVPEIASACNNHPTLGDKLRVSVIEFSNTASVVTELSKYDVFQHSPGLVPGGAGTHYGVFFKCVKAEITKAIPELVRAETAKGLSKFGVAPKIGVFRPTVFLFTDGEPNDNECMRDDAWDDLTDPDFIYHPNFFTFGVGEADRDEIEELKSGHGLVLIQKPGSDISNAIKEILVLLVQSIVMSATDPDQCGGGQIIISPDDIADLSSIELLD